MQSVIVDKTLLESDPLLFNKLAQETHADISLLSYYYPKFEDWYVNKVEPGLATGERKLLLYYSSDKLAGIAVLKDGELEQKICCLRVLPGFQGSGVGIKLFQRSFEVLSNESPLLSVAEEQLPTFKRVFDYFGFELASTYKNIYRPHRHEHSFNGLLVEMSDRSTIKYHDPFMGSIQSI